jgi:hypothetical protein
MWRRQGLALVLCRLHFGGVVGRAGLRGCLVMVREVGVGPRGRLAKLQLCVDHDAHARVGVQARRLEARWAAVAG